MGIHFYPTSIRNMRNLSIVLCTLICCTSVSSAFHTLGGSRTSTALLSLQRNNEKHEAATDISAPEMDRRSSVTKLVQWAGLGSLSLLAAAITLPTSAQAAPPIAIIAEELGYFPVTNSQGTTVYVPKRIQRESSAQAMQLAQALQDQGAVIYTAYWCPHCARQKELFGRQAWSLIRRNVECAPQGYNAQPAVCVANKVDGYPTWVLKNGKRISGERPLSVLAKEIGYTGSFDEELEQNVPPPLGSSACK